MRREKEKIAIIVYWTYLKKAVIKSKVTLHRVVDLIQA